MLSNTTFYPTPPRLISKMIAKIKGHPIKILEPSAGKGDIVEALVKSQKYYNHNLDISAIEIDPNLQATLRGKGIKLIDTDFLTFSGPDKFCAIIANPPFDDGDKHLLKAIEIMYRGQIVFLLNAETLRNPHTNNRKLLVRKLEELGAEIEYIKDAFLEAERKTAVEVALVNIVIDRKVEDDLFADCDDHAGRTYETVKDKNEVSTGKTIVELVAEYNLIIQTGQETIIGYYRNFRKVGKYLGLNAEAKERNYSSGDLTTMMQGTLNRMTAAVRTDFWRKTLDIPEYRERMTKKKRDEFEHQLTARCHMDFTESNIRQFFLNLVGSYEQTLTEAVLDLFDMFSDRHSWHNDNPNEKNVHYFNGWKTNKAFKVGKRVVIPCRGGYRSAFLGWSGQWDMSHDAAAFLDDIDKVMNYFDGMAPYERMSTAINRAFARGDTSGIESTYFRATCHKKGTIHLTFLNMDILRRFNVVACRGKGWLPQDYGAKVYAQLSHEEQAVADAFDGGAVYKKSVNRPLFDLGNSNLLGLENKPTVAQPELF